MIHIDLRIKNWGSIMTNPKLIMIFWYHYLKSQSQDPNDPLKSLWHQLFCLSILLVIYRYALDKSLIIILMICIMNKKYAKNLPLKGSKSRAKSWKNMKYASFLLSNPPKSKELIIKAKISSQIVKLLFFIIIGFV